MITTYIFLSHLEWTKLNKVIEKRGKINLSNRGKIFSEDHSKAENKSRSKAA